MDPDPQYDQHQWLAIADFDDEADAQDALAVLGEQGIPAMIDQRTMSARFALLVSVLERDEAMNALRAEEFELVDPDTADAADEEGEQP